MDKQEESHSRNIPSKSNPFMEDSNIMSSSYSEISPFNQNYEKMDIGDDSLEEEEKAGRSKRPDSLYDNFLDGDLTVDENNMKHYIAENLESLIKVASPVGNITPSTSKTIANSLPKQFITPLLPPQIDSNVLNDLEISAQYLAADVDNLTENLANLLHSISSITADNVDIYRSAVSKLTDTMDSNIKSMYTIIAKTEEISKSMNKSLSVYERIKEVKRLVDLFESSM